MEIYCYTYLHCAHPTLGRPTMPHLRDVPNLPSKGPGPSASAPFFFGGIFFLCLKEDRYLQKLASNLFSLKCLLVKEAKNMQEQ